MIVILKGLSTVCFKNKGQLSGEKTTKNKPNKNDEILQGDISVHNAWLITKIGKHFICG